MNIDLLRKFDYFVGIPTCFLLSLFERFRNILLSKKEETPIKKILIIKPFELGSIILSFPLIEEIKRTHTNTELFFLTSERNKEVLSLFNHIPINHIITFNENSFFSLILSLLKAIHQIRKIHIDTAIDLEFFSRFSMVLSYLSKTKRRIGFYKYAFEGLYRGQLLTHKIQYNPHLHISQLYYSFYEAIALVKKETPTSCLSVEKQPVSLPIFTPTDEQTQKIFKTLSSHKIDHTKNLYLINPGDGLLPLRDWPIENFIEVINRILENPHNIVILVGTFKSKDKSASIIETIKNERIINFTNDTSLGELLTLIALSKCLICNDSGMAHLGALTSTKQIVLFGPEHPRVFAPLGENIRIFYLNTICSPCLSVYNHRKSNCLNNLCLKNISPEEVFNALKD